MKKKFYLCSFLLLSIISQGVGDLSEDNIEKASAHTLVRKKRKIDNRPEKNRQKEIEEALAYTGSLERYAEHICGVTYLLAYLVLTAASCVPDHGKVDKKFNPYTVRTGSKNVKHGQPHSVSRIIVIDATKKGDAKGNLALLVVTPEIDFKNMPSRPIGLPTCEPTIGYSLIISGWGRGVKQPGKQYHQELHAATVHLIRCPYEDEAKYMCTEDPSGHNQIKFGKTDVGGPVFANRQLFGIYLKADNPAVHAKIFHSKYLPWIKYWISSTEIIPHRPHVKPHPHTLPNMPWPMPPYPQYPPLPYPHQYYPPQGYPPQQYPPQFYPPQPYPLLPYPPSGNPVTDPFQQYHHPPYPY